MRMLSILTLSLCIVPLRTSLPFPASLGSGCDSNCSQCTSNRSICMQCKGGYYLSAGSCYGCEANCSSCTSSTHCTSCLKGFKLNYGSCEKEFLHFDPRVAGLCILVVLCIVCKKCGKCSRRRKKKSPANNSRQIEETLHNSPRNQDPFLETRGSNNRRRVPVPPIQANVNFPSIRRQQPPLMQTRPLVRQTNTNQELNYPEEPVVLIGQPPMDNIYLQQLEDNYQSPDSFITTTNKLDKKEGPIYL